MLQLYVSEFSNFEPLFTKNGCWLLSHFSTRGNLIVHCSNSVIIIIKTGNWDFGKLKGGDNEFHSLNDIRPDQTSKCVVLSEPHGV